MASVCVCDAFGLWAAHSDQYHFVKSVVSGVFPQAHASAPGIAFSLWRGSGVPQQHPLRLGGNIGLLWSAADLVCRRVEPTSRLSVAGRSPSLNLDPKLSESISSNTSVPRLYTLQLTSAGPGRLVGSRRSTPSALAMKPWIPSVRRCAPSLLLSGCAGASLHFSLLRSGLCPWLAATIAVVWGSAGTRQWTSTEPSHIARNQHPTIG